MKTLMILIVAAGISAGDDPQSALEIREIEFRNLDACQRMAEALNQAGRSAEQRAMNVLAKQPSLRLPLTVPVVIAECIDP